jgi:predicted phosphodiesterase
MRVLVLSDIHANLVALETVLNTAAGQYDTVWCLGDIVGYGPRPNECVELVRAHATVCVMGNHDLAVVGRPDIDVENFNPHAKHAVLWTREVLSAENRAYLTQLADRPIRPLAELSLLLTHASPREPVWEYILTPNAAWENFRHFSEEICLVGHTHKPAIYRWRIYQEMDLDHSDGQAEEPYVAEVAELHFGADLESRSIKLDTSEELRLIINPGSVGQPRDNDARAAYAILDLEKMSWEYHRVRYPIDLTQNQMVTVNLPKRLIDRLSYGW